MEWDSIAKRLRCLIILSGLGGAAFGWKWTAQCGQWVPVIIWIRDVYKEDEKE